MLLTITGAVSQESVSFEQIETMSIAEMAEKVVMNCVDIKTFDDFFLVLWDGSPLEGEGKSGEIRVFDWKGHLLERIPLDRRARSFAYDNKFLKLYLLDENEKIYSAHLNVNHSDM